MLKRRLLTTIATVAFVTGVLGADPARAQAPLGFTIDPTQGVPGETVTGQVDVADVQESCVTDLAEFQAQFQALLEGPFAGGAPEGELFSRFFPGDDFVFETCDQAAYSLTGITAFAIALNFDGAAETALPQTFVMTFADIATQEPVGELGSFDPGTGVGSVVVPNVEPGPWAVAAACVEPVLDLDLLEAGIRENGAFLESLGFPTCDLNSAEFGEYVEELLGPGADIFAFLNAFGPTFIQNIVEPSALGFQIFTVLTPEAGIANLIADIEALVTAGELKAGQARGLTRPLRNALRSLERGNVRAACSQLADFIAEVNEKLADGVLDEAVAEDLITQAEGIQALIGCGVPGTTTTTTAAPTTTTTSTTATTSPPTTTTTPATTTTSTTAPTTTTTTTSTTTSTTTTTAPGSPSPAFLDRDA